MNKISTLVAALMVAAHVGGGAHAATIEQLEMIDRYTAAGDVRGLRGFLAANPGLLTEGTPLAQELKSFMETPERGGFLAAIGIVRPSVPPSIAQATSQERQSLY